MRGDNIIPFPLDVRVAIELEIHRAVARFGHNVEIMAIAAKWHGTMDDRQVLTALRKINQIGDTLPKGQTDDGY
ncbi:hypothetical protein [Neomesorhizobium albiziae]|nr:hypothetical protein [Mesorhizobium albiziae]GLS34402.1 hypothetical protein GCM10007937_61170 [Mesorhizobium albiziae]